MKAVKGGMLKVKEIGLFKSWAYYPNF